MLSNVSNAPSESKGWALGLWTVQVLLALAFGMAGVMKSTAPLEALAANMAWVSNVPGGLVRFIGIAELLGAIGLILPAATRILPILTPAAATGLLVIMVLAAGYHVLLAEYAGIVPDVVLGAMAGLVAWGRIRKAPIAARR